MTPAPAPIPEEMVEKAATALLALDWVPHSAAAWTVSRKVLEAAGVPALLARVAELEAALAKR